MPDNPKGHWPGSGKKTVSFSSAYGRETSGEQPLAFRLPTPESLVASANRLLKFEFPPNRNLIACERLVKSNLEPGTGLSKRQVEEMPLPLLEEIYAGLWYEMLGVRQASPGDAWLNLYLLVEDLIEFQAEAIIRADIAMLGQYAAEPIHSYYFTESTGVADLRRLLELQGYRADLLAGTGEEDKRMWQTAYLACRRLSRPLPWQKLLACLDQPLLEQHPRLQRMKFIEAALAKSGWFHQPLDDGNWQVGLKHLRQFLDSARLAERNAQCRFPRPIRELVIVEGETEKLLLPVFAQTMGKDLNMLGIHLLPAGGKNHVLTLYRNFSEWLRCPVCVVLDGDATDVSEELQPLLRPSDCLYQIREGEFEDTYDLTLVARAINEHYQPYPELTPQSLLESETKEGLTGRVQQLKSLWQNHGWGSFDKVQFAGMLADVIQPPGEAIHNLPPSDAVRLLLESILEVRANALANYQGG